MKMPTTFGEHATESEKKSMLDQMASLNLNGIESTSKTSKTLETSNLDELIQKYREKLEVSCRNYEEDLRARTKDNHKNQQEVSQNGNEKLEASRRIKEQDLSAHAEDNHGSSTTKHSGKEQGHKTTTVRGGYDPRKVGRQFLGSEATKPFVTLIPNLSLGKAPAAKTKNSKPESSDLKTPPPTQKSNLVKETEVFGNSSFEFAKMPALTHRLIARSNMAPPKAEEDGIKAAYELMTSLNHRPIAPRRPMAWSTMTQPKAKEEVIDTAALTPEQMASLAPSRRPMAWSTLTQPKEKKDRTDGSKKEDKDELEWEMVDESAVEERQSAPNGGKTEKKGWLGGWF